MEEIQKLIAGFKRFQRQYFGEDEELMRRLRAGQQPKALVVACSDSRVDPALLTDAGPGELFVVRNVANLVPPCERDATHHGVSAALEFAVCNLGVEHIIVLGHSQCGGIQGLLAGSIGAEVGEFIGRWVSLAAPARDQVLRDLPHKPPELRARACEQASILLSLENLLTFPFIGERVESGSLALHGWYYDIAAGALWHYVPATARFEILVPAAAAS